MRPRWWILFVVALAIRLVHVQWATALGHYDQLYLDSEFYARTAAALRVGAGGEGEPYSMSPLYPYVLALFTDGEGELQILWIRWFQILMGAGTVFLTALLAGRLGGRSAGWMAGGLAALYGPLIHFDGTILVASLQGFFLTLGVYLIVREQVEAVGERSSLRLWLGAGVAFGLSAALRATTLALVAATVVALVVQEFARRSPARNGKGVGLRVAALVSGVLVVILPFTARNALVSGDAVLLSANGGFNFYVGNQPGSQGVFRNPPGYDFATDPIGARLAARESGQDLSLAEASRYWRQRAWQNIAADPGAWLRLLGRKLMLFAHPKEIPQLGQSFQWFRESLPTLRFPLDARLVLLLALLSPLVLAPAGGRAMLWRIRWPLFLLLAYAAAIALFFVTGRYRIPIMPIALALAGVCLVNLGRQLGAILRGSSYVGLTPVALLLVLLLSSQRLYLADGAPFSLPDSLGVEERQLGMRLYQRGRFQEAVLAYRQGLQRGESLMTRNNLANALKALSRQEKAAGQIERARQLLRESREQYELVLRANPEREYRAWYNYGNLLREDLGDLSAAASAYRRALAIQPSMGPAHLNLGVTLERMGRLSEAAAAVEAALRWAGPQDAWRGDAARLLRDIRVRDPSAR